MPALKAQTAPIPEGVIDDSWLDLSRASKLSYLAMMALSGRVSVDICTSLAKILESAAAVENVDALDMILNGKVLMGNGDKQEYNRLQHAHELNCKILETVQADNQRFRELMAKDGLDDLEDTDNTDTDDTETGDSDEQQ